MIRNSHRWSGDYALASLLAAHQRHGLLIHWAYFRTSPAKPWIFLLWDARVSEIFVPYHNNCCRFYDVEFGFPPTPIGAARYMLGLKPLKRRGRSKRGKSVDSKKCGKHIS